MGANITLSTGSDKAVRYILLRVDEISRILQRVFYERLGFVSQGSATVHDEHFDRDFTMSVHLRRPSAGAERPSMPISDVV